jgi:uncharacterized protein YndB with AHSA1/START domain
MTTQPLGTIERDGQRRTVRHVRHYGATPEEVWAALTEPHQVKNWLAEMTIEPRAGGRISFRWEAGETETGEVRVFDPPRTFEYTWEEGSISHIRFQLAPDADGTVLVLEHSLIAPDSAAGIGAGWHSHLDALDAVLGGSHQAPRDWNERYEELLPDYRHAAAQ